MIRRTRVSLLAALLAASTACGQSPKFALRAPVSIPFEPVQRLVVLRAAVNGSRPLSFVLDTGNKYTIIDVERAKELGLEFGKEIRVRGSGAETGGAFVRNASCSIAGLPRFTLPVTIAIPLRPLASRIGHDFDGILGADFIQQFVVEIDYGAKRVRLHDRDAFHYTGTGHSTPIHLNSSGHPVMQAALTPVGREPIPVELVVDTGSNGALDLRAPFVAAHHLPGPGVRTIPQIGAAGAGGGTAGQVGRVAQLALAGFELRNPVAVFSEDESGTNATSETQGKVGARILSRFRLFLDYAHDRLIFEPAAALNDPFEGASSGMAIESSGPGYRTFRITGVLDGSAAADARLRAGDLIESVDSRDASRLTLTEIVELFERGGAHALKVRRGSEVLDVSLVPRREL